jgi:hypothetical protein
MRDGNTMAHCGSRVTAACFSVALIFVTWGAIAAGGGQLLATIDNPAIVTVAPAAGPESEARNRSGRLVLKVAGFKPAQDGSAVQAVVKVEKADGTEQEVHRFTVFPQTEFKASNPSKFLKFGFSLPKELAIGGSVRLKVELVPLRGKGNGASLEVAGVEREHVH